MMMHIVYHILMQLMRSLAVKCRNTL